ncbi:uncharacterized protein LOC122946932 [Acropora millepora]|uniref:uncharacterized protein LOC114956373 n=1 Tax=Acropora millepora TaxID=45264 RepID=UPI0010FC9839|nr:uncharacterized protein LOC114956373 [Acropora millepora]XP_029189302.1 uncharacterized protein LOC114956373 [Acropora millepora]XP_029189303.1 uncharacterized protein LOC114956373 [Acropora millepora]XP_029189304.1 uncharacterized protein LOC114956373 [Acropora millepora]XP_044163616.1 uncharacterized protein LOC122946932 [Acropora millepora]XP_044163617.1 uncharacterized protein LOC122946932 [Acropora millepora]XP_044163618.1 uncharacterized protein LOC122946932 [Acropora millepora]XP_0
MTLVIPVTNLWSFTMEDQCLDEDDTLLADDWETPSSELNFLCNNLGDEDIYRVKDRGIKRKDPCNVDSETTAVSLVDQRRFILEVTFEKLRRLEDPEACLRRTVLINNTLKMLHKQIYTEENPFVCGGVVTLHSTESPTKEETSPPNPKMIRLSFDNSVAENPRTKRVDNSSSLTSRENFFSDCSLSNVLSEDVEDDVFEPAEEISCERESAFGELDSVFHSYICALET